MKFLLYVLMIRLLNCTIFIIISKVRQNTQMFLEQNLFSIYRLILKTPRIIFVAALIFAIFVAVTQIAYVTKTRRALDLSQPLLEYMIKKNEQRKDIKEQLAQSLEMVNVSSINSSSLDTDNETNINDYTFIDDSTLLHFRFADIDQYNISLNYSYNYTTDQKPFMVLIKNQHLTFLKDSTKEYLQRHGIMYDLITLPPFEVERPLFSYFFQDDLQKNEVLLDSMQASFFLLDARFNIYRIINNITDGSMEISQLFLNFYYQSNGDLQYISINFFQFLSFKMFPKLFVKVVFGCGGLFLIFAASVFTGLLIRYTIISAFTLYLSVYDRYMSHNGGWVHLYLVLIYKRFQEGRINALKTLIFFIASQIGVSLLLAFGAYCILTKLIMTSMPLMVDQYTTFLMKTIFFIQLFHYVISRSRTTIKFFPILSSITNFVLYTICGLKISSFTLMVLNINLTVQIIFFIGFALIEKSIVEENQKGLSGQYCPSYSKPRMLFYAGYDINWEKSLPPIWTYFTRWFDYSFFNESQRSLLERDYQLLYGRMLGFNERQEVPQEDDEEGEVQMRQGEQQSNEML